MIKSIIKETFIMILLCVVIVLILGILFYDYIPTNRIIPTKESYVAPENVRAEVDARITELEKSEVSYEISDSDLNLYKQTSSYKPGKSDPFALHEETPVTNDTNNQTNTNGGSSSKEPTNNNEEPKTDVNKNSTGTFFNDDGIK